MEAKEVFILSKDELKEAIEEASRSLVKDLLKDQVEDEEIWTIADICRYLGKTSSNISGAQRYLIPFDVPKVNGGWPKRIVMQHLAEYAISGGYLKKRYEKFCEESSKSEFEERLDEAIVRGNV